MAGTTHIYAGVAGTVGMTHSGGLGGVFRQEVGDVQVAGSGADPRTAILGHQNAQWQQRGRGRTSYRKP